LFWIIIFPGFLFTVVLGLAASWIVRKVSAVVQYRVGPPFYQPFADVIKLMGKEILIPEKAQQFIFMASPIFGFAGAVLLATVLWQAAIRPESLFVGDIIVVMYLMVIPSLALILGSSSSASPHASIGTGREMKLVLSYELPIVLALIVVIIKSGGQINLSQIAQQTPVLSISGFIAFAVSLLCIQAKLGFVPFDMAEAETELASGVLIEYSGALLAIWQLMQSVLLVALPMFIVTVFMGGFDTGSVGLIILSILKYVLVLVLVILIKNTNPRVRIDQAMKFFWLYCGLAMIIAVMLATIGNNYGISWL
jgi:NADH-quinone oxidoreductase subunit H